MKKYFVTLLLLTMGLASVCAGGKKEAMEESAQSDNILHVMNQAEVDSLDPQVTMSLAGFEVIANFTDGLKQLDKNGATVNALCKEEQVSDDGLVYTFTLRDDATWSNGTPVTAADFVYGWRRGVDPAIASEYSYMFSAIGHVKNAAQIIAGELPVEDLGIVALDTYTLQVTLEVPVPYFDGLLYFVTFYPVNQAFCESCGDTYATSADTLLSNGAFIMDNYEPAANRFSLVKNPQYYDASRISLDGLDYQILKDSQQALMSYQNGDLDLIILSGDQIDQVKEDPEYQSFGAGYLWYLCPNVSGSKEMANKNFRLAITNVLNRQSIVDDVTKDGSVPSYAMVPSGLSYDADGVDFTSSPDTYSAVCSDNIAKAQAYYKKAQAELGEDTMELKFLVDDTSLQQNIAVVIKEQLESAFPGLTVNLTVEPKKQRIADSFAGNFDLVMTGWGPDYADATTYLSMFTTGNSVNFGQWSNADYDALIDECMAGDLISKPAERLVALKKAEAIGMNEAVMMPLYQQSNAVMIKPNVTGVAFHPVALDRVFKDVVKQ